MVVKIIYRDKNLYLLRDRSKVLNICELLAYLSNNRMKISALNIEGETNSFTFQRQIYLLANLFSKISGAKVKINKSNIQDEILLPVYKG